MKASQMEIPEPHYPIRRPTLGAATLVEATKLLSEVQKTLEGGRGYSFSSGFSLRLPGEG
jgi:hypothetical protein